LIRIRKQQGNSFFLKLFSLKWKFENIQSFKNKEKERIHISVNSSLIDPSQQSKFKLKTINKYNADGLYPEHTKSRMQVS